MTSINTQASIHAAATATLGGEIEVLAVSHMMQSISGSAPTAAQISAQIAGGGITHAMLDVAIASLFTGTSGAELNAELVHLTETSSGTVFGDSSFTGAGINAADIAAVASGTFTVAAAQAAVPEAIGQGVEQIYSAFSGHTGTVNQLYHEGMGISNQMLNQGIASLFDSGLTAGQLTQLITMDTINGGDTAYENQGMNVTLIGQNPANYTAFHHIG